MYTSKYIHIYTTRTHVPGFWGNIEQRRSYLIFPSLLTYSPPCAIFPSLLGFTVFDHFLLKNHGFIMLTLWNFRKSLGLFCEI